MDINTALAVIIPACVLGLVYAFFNFILVRKVNI
jgi:hypothetical protein